MKKYIASKLLTIKINIFCLSSCQPNILKSLCLQPLCPHTTTSSPHYFLTDSQILRCPTQSLQRRRDGAVWLEDSTLSTGSSSHTSRWSWQSSCKLFLGKYYWIIPCFFESNQYYHCPD